MKAINYRGQNDFYLFDKPEMEEDSEGYTNSHMLHDYHVKLQANLSAGKKIINPEVFIVGVLKDASGTIMTCTGERVKPGQIFDCPDNIEFEERERCVECGALSNEDCKNIPYDCEVRNKTVIRLFLKEEPKPSPVETQESVMDDMFSQYFKMISEGKSMHYAVQNLKSKFTITRKP